MEYLKRKGLVRVMMAMLMLFGLGMVRSDVGKDKEECTDQLVGLATCLPYVGGESKAPTPDCCTGVKSVLDKSKKCLCVLIKDRNDPNLNLKINVSLALRLPDLCHAPPFNASQCPALLHMTPHSPDAKAFTDLLNSTSSQADIHSPANGKSNAAATNADAKSDAEAIKRRHLRLQIVLGIVISVLLQYDLHA